MNVLCCFLRTREQILYYFSIWILPRSQSGAFGLTGGLRAAKNFFHGVG
jgi:hypothetical protein